MRRALALAALLLTVGGLWWWGAWWHAGEHALDQALPRAPTFSLPSLGGEPIALESIPGELRVVYFWASWSPYARDDLAVLARIKREQGDALTVVALDRDTNVRDGRAFAEALDLRDSVLFVFDSDDAYFKRAGGFAVPETLFLDRAGGILEQVHGPLTEDVLRERIAVYLKQAGR